jgi:DNA-binding beta-propeller fold protein YncE
MQPARALAFFGTVTISAALIHPWMVQAEDATDAGDQEKVGYSSPERAVTPVNQILTPVGKQVDLPGLRPQGAALSPDGQLLAVSGKTSEVIIIDPASGDIRQRVTLPSDAQKLPSSDVVSPMILNPDEEPQLSFTGLIFSPSGDRLYLSNVEGSVKIFAVKDGKVTPSHSYVLPAAKAPRRDAEIPSGLAVTSDGKRLYVCGNLSNRLLELDAHSGEVLRTFDVGVAPYDVVLVGDKAYVSNWGGRRPGPGDLTGPAGRGTVVRVDPVRHIASEGSVSVIDLGQGKVLTELLTGLHASGLAVSPDKRYVVCANAASDHLSVIDAKKDAVIQTLWARAKPSDLLGASPNALAFDRTGKRLFAANGAQNAIAVFDFDPKDAEDSQLRGLIPVGWYPGALAYDAARNSIIAANIKGLPKTPENSEDREGAKGFNSHQYSGSLSIVPMPTDEELADHSAVVAANLRAPRIAEALLPPRKNQPPRAIPERIGESSHIKHVVYVIKENRTYDQVFGGLERGNGDPSLCIFGRESTPNQHKIAEQFVLLDNTYCAGILSADGHEWSTTAFSTDYMEKSFAGFPRSYPDGMGIDENDALAYSPAGFIWDNALKHKKSVRNYGEFMIPTVRWRDPARNARVEKEEESGPDFTACYRAWKNKTDDVVFDSVPSVETMHAFSPPGYVGWAMEVPDQHRADFILKELEQFEKKGEFPNLVIICLPNDHTSGTSAGCPTPRACIADNDLAFGRIIEALSRSRFWKQMAIFSIEDDPQAGWDHVSGYRTIAFCASPYAKRGAVVSTQYNTTSILRTIEQILGLPPMNQFDASATPMFDCFTETPDFTPYAAEPTNIPLDEMNPSPEDISDAALREDAIVSSKLNFREVDRAPEDVLNRILWRAVRGSAEPYPEWAVTAVDEDEEEEERAGRTE